VTGPSPAGRLRAAAKAIDNGHGFFESMTNAAADALSAWLRDVAADLDAEPDLDEWEPDRLQLMYGHPLAFAALILDAREG
jgi:hypothetical protein